MLKQLFADRELPRQHHQQESDDGWEEREQRPYHRKHRIGDTGWVDHRITHLICYHVGTCPAQEEGDERTGNGGTKLLAHRTGREDKTRS